MRFVRVAVRSLFVLAVTLPPASVSAQQSLSPTLPSGQTVTPVYEGWYRNKDGTYSLSFGYFNRNSAERMSIPVGDSNFVSPGAPNQGQPTHFEPRRHWGVFAVVVPADFGTKKVTWTLRDRGQTFAIPGSLHTDWQIDAIEGEASADNTPPALSFTEGGPMGVGPFGITSTPVQGATWDVLAFGFFGLAADAEAFGLALRALALSVAGRLSPSAIVAVTVFFFLPSAA